MVFLQALHQATYQTPQEDINAANTGCAKMPPMRRHVRTSNRYTPLNRVENLETSL